ncbi:MAG TPA: SusC/RagA family TonB-linked outer membrane protein [Puia sp.]
MKLTSVLLIMTCLHVSAKVHSQERITLSEKNAPLKTILQEIRKQTGYAYVFNDQWEQQIKKINIEVRNASVEEVLDLCFRDQPFSYLIVNKTIVVKKKDDKTRVNGELFPRAFIDIHGRVVDESNKPAAGVTVTVKGTKISTVTDDNGEFSLKTIDKNAVLVFTSVNMQAFEIKVEGKMDLEINLKTKIATLGGVTVEYSSGYQIIPKERATGSFAQPYKQLFDARVSTDVISRLEGITSGLVFNVTAQGNKEIGVRGRSTIFANSQPLIILDNFPYDGDINNINPNDIENVTVLKDAAAASIWGVRAGNGVIVITTKKGHLNQPLRISLNSNVTVAKKSDVFYNPNFLKSSDFIGVERTLFGQGFYDGDLNDLTSPPISPVVEILNNQRNGLITTDEANSQINTLSKYDVRYDLSKFFYHSPVNQQYAINVNGGSKKDIYLFSAGYDRNSLPQVSGKYKRITLNSFNTFFPIDNLEVTVGINYIQNQTDNDNTLSQIFTGGPNGRSIYPYAKLADAARNPLPILKDYRTDFVESATANGFLNWQFYPLQELRGGYNTSTAKNNDIRSVASIKYTFFKGLSADVKYQYEMSSMQGSTLASDKSYYARNVINQYSNVLNGIVTGYNVPIGGVLTQSYSDLTSKNFRTQLNYSKTWRKHDIRAIAGFEAREVAVLNNSNTLFGYNDNTGTFKLVDLISYFSLYPTGNYSPISSSISVSGTLNRFRSYFSNVAYTYNDRYTISLSGRIDQSNLFGVSTNQRSVPLWSTGIKWDLDKEKFYHSKLLTYFRLRATYGFNGNLDNTVTAFTTGEYISGALYTGAPYAQIDNPPNPKLRWEKTSIVNIGMDFETANKIISGSIEYFSKKGIDLMGDATLAPSIGFVNPLTLTNSIRGNYSNMRGQGVDIQLTSRNIDKRFKWYTNFIFSYATDKVTRYTVKNDPSKLVYYGDGSYSLITPIEGKPVFGIYSYQWGGLDPNTGVPRGYINKGLSTDYSSLVNPTQIQDIVYNGPSRPVFFGGISNTFSWKHISISASISYKLGYYFRRSSINYYSLFYGWSGGNKDFSQRWQTPGDEKRTNIPSMPAIADISREQFYAYSKTLVEKADHIRFQDINVSYEFDKSTCPKLPFMHLQLYAYINNIGVIWRANRSGLDPDYLGGLPASRSIAMGVRTNF